MFKHINTYLLRKLYSCPISVKGVIFINGKVLLLKNGRGLWELPGGRPEKGETYINCVKREIKEELNLDVLPQRIIDVWVYEVLPGARVIILSYACAIAGTQTPQIKISQEHKDFGQFAPEELCHIPLPGGYYRSVIKSLRQRR